MNNSEKDGGFVKLIPGFRKHFPKAASPRHEFSIKRAYLSTWQNPFHRNLLNSAAF